MSTPRDADAAEFCRASVADWTGKAARMLAADPELAAHSFATAVVLGDAERVRDELARDPGLATRHDDDSGWTALHAVSGSRWHMLDPARTDGLVMVATLLLDAGADLDDRGGGGGMTPLGCAAASASAGAGNEPLIRLLLERGAVPDDRDLYLAGFATNNLRVLRLLLDAGADPRRYRNDDGAPSSAVYEAVLRGGPAELVELFIEHGADPVAPGPDGRSPHRLATARGRADLAELLRRHGAPDDSTADDRFAAACLRADEDAARGQHSHVPREAMVIAAETGNANAVRLMLDLGFPIDSPVNDDGGTVLHVAAYAGSIDVVRDLVSRGANIESRDTTWQSTPLGWAIEGSGRRPTTNPDADWPGTVQALRDAGAGG